MSQALDEEQIRRFKDQVLIVLIKRLAKEGRLVLPASEVDGTGQDLLAMSVDRTGRNFIFELGKKS